MIFVRTFIVVITGAMALLIGYLPIVFFKWLYAIVAPTTELTRVLTLMAFWVCGGGITVSLWFCLFVMFSMIAAAMITVKV